jgi:exonuclease SbcC
MTCARVSKWSSLLLLPSRGNSSGVSKKSDRHRYRNRQKLAGLEAEIEKARAELEVWRAVNAAVGSKNGDRFARFAQSITLDVLADSANRHLADLNPRYRLRRAADLALQVEDIDMGGEARATRSLSGGERFLVSLALALALSRMGGKGGLAATLFIDEASAPSTPPALTSPSTPWKVCNHRVGKSV